MILFNIIKESTLLKKAHLQFRFERSIEMKKAKKEKPLWDIFPDLTRLVLKDHQRKKIEPGHDFFHALMVAQYGLIIAPEEKIGILAWVAGLCHNTDRVFAQDFVERRVRYYLNVGGVDKNLISISEKDLILEAVMHHSELNSSSDNPVTIVLKDADRLSNAGAICVVRSAQFHYDKPSFNPKPTMGAKFRDEKTVLDSMRITLEWEKMLRCPKAIELGRKYFQELRQLIRSLEDQIRETGINDFPIQLGES